MVEPETDLRNLGGVSLFTGDAIQPGHLKQMIRSVALAPSAANAQPWEIVVIESAEGKIAVLRTILDPQFRPLSEEAKGREHWLFHAPVVFVLAMDTLRAEAKFGAAGSNRFGLVDMGAAGQNLLITARSLGIEGTVIREFDIRALGEGLGFPPHVQPVLVCGMGYPSQPPLDRPVLSPQDVSHYESWNGSGSDR